MRGVPNKNEISDVVIINVVIKVESYSEAWKIVIKEICQEIILVKEVSDSVPVFKLSDVVKKHVHKMEDNNMGTHSINFLYTYLL